MKQNNKITTLIFDFGGVLINLDMAQCMERFRQLGFEDIGQYIGMFGQQDFFLQYEKGEIDTARFRDEIRRHTGRANSDEEIEEAWGAFLLDIPHEKIDLLQQLKKRYRLLLLSNTNPIHIEQNARKELARYGLTLSSLFDSCYLSYRMGVTKPNPAIFETLLENEHLQPDECLFLDDGAKNIEQAARLGFRTYLVKPQEDLSFLLTTDL